MKVAFAGSIAVRLAEHAWGAKAKLIAANIERIACGEPPLNVIAPLA